MNGLETKRRYLERQKGALAIITQRIAKVRGKIGQLESALIDAEEARTLLQQVAKETQSALEYHVAELATLAMQSVLPAPYELKILFDSKWDRTEASIILCRDGKEVSPMDASGGGVVDVVTFGLRMSLWTLQNPRSAPVFILDEPFTAVSRDLQDRVSSLLKEISERLGVQMIIVTHEEAVIAQADRIFHVALSDGVSSVTQEGLISNVVRKATRKRRRKAEQV